MIQAGDKFGFLTAVCDAGRNRHGESLWGFACVCGKEHTTYARLVKSGRAKSCGCMRKDIMKKSMTKSWARRKSLLPTTTDKQCSRCRETKSLDDFAKNGERHSYYCRLCFKAYTLHWEHEKSKHDVAYKARRLAKNLKENEHPRRRYTLLFLKCKHNAIRRQIPFNIAKPDVLARLNAQEWKCAKTGIRFDLTTGRGKPSPFGPTIDRIDNEGGYDIENIQIVCNMYNYAKNAFEDDDVLTFAHALVAHQKPAINKPQLRIVS